MKKIFLSLIISLCLFQASASDSLKLRPSIYFPISNIANPMSNFGLGAEIPLNHKWVAELEFDYIFDSWYNFPVTGYIGRFALKSYKVLDETSNYYIGAQLVYHFHEFDIIYNISKAQNEYIELVDGIRKKTRIALLITMGTEFHLFNNFWLDVYLSGGGKFDDVEVLHKDTEEPLTSFNEPLWFFREANSTLSPDFTFGLKLKIKL